VRFAASTLLGAVLLALVDVASLPTPLFALAVAAVGVTVALVAAAVLVSRPEDGRPGPCPGATLRARARLRRLPRVLDPDGAGRPRPRAPSLHLA